MSVYVDSPARVEEMARAAGADVERDEHTAMTTIGGVTYCALLPSEDCDGPPAYDGPEPYDEPLSESEQDERDKALWNYPEGGQWL